MSHTVLHLYGIDRSIWGGLTSLLFNQQSTKLPTKVLFWIGPPSAMKLPLSTILRYSCVLQLWPAWTHSKIQPPGKRLRGTCNGQQASLSSISAQNRNVVTVAAVKSKAAVIVGKWGGIDVEIMLDSGSSVSLVQQTPGRPRYFFSTTAAANPTGDSICGRTFGFRICLCSYLHR